MNHYVRLSYPLDVSGPVFPGTPPITVNPVHRMDQGDPCNSALVTIFNHSGTHLDFPRHYVQSGRCLVDYSIDELIFSSPCAIDLSRGGNEAISPDDLAARQIPLQTDLLLLRTGFYKKRGAADYCSCPPVLTVEAATYLRSEFPNLRCIGIDYVSITNVQHRTTGDRVHRVLLNPEPDGKPILILEDVDLSQGPLLLMLTKVFIVPLYIEGIDSFSCTVIGEYNHGD